MKYVIMLVLLSIFLVSCQANMDTPIVNDVEMSDDLDHIGCQEGEIDANGECLPAMESNVLLFGQDFSGQVVTETIENDVQGFLAKPAEEGSYPGVGKQRTAERNLSAVGENDRHSREKRPFHE